MTGGRKDRKAKKNGKNGAPVSAAKKRQEAAQHNQHAGLLALIGSLLLLSALAGVHFEPKVRLYLEGEIAGQDVKSDLDILIEDSESTKRKREQVADSQPPIFDFSRQPALDLEKRIQDVLDSVATMPEEDIEQGRWQISETLNREIRPETIAIWRSKNFTDLMQNQVYPWLRTYLNNGVVSEKRLLQPYRQGVLIRDLESGTERLVTNPGSIRDLSDLENDFAHFRRRELGQPLRIRRAILDLIEPLISPNTFLNHEATKARKDEVVAAVEPVYYQIKKGEIIVRQGERVGPDQQLKLQTLFSQHRDVFDVQRAVGLFCVGLLIVLGLYLSNLHYKSVLLSNRDGLFLACTLFLFGLLAKLVAVMASPLAKGIIFLQVQPELFAYMLPLAGAFGVAALFFPLYLCFFSGILISYYCTILTNGGLGLFMFSFVSGIFYVFLIKRTQNRSDVLASVFPLLGALILTWLGVGLVNFQGWSWLGEGLVATCVGGVLSLLSLLAFSTIAELIFGYTSRFKLMELMNLEQPLLQQLMVNAPGTYHHSLVVANMVEAGARAIGANSLLAKVAALYHDVGKLKKPQYFIENQFGGVNVHDKLAPSMSALVLISHVKKGVELAQQYRLGPEITDLIQQHHGTSLISYFYNKAIEQAEQRGEGAVREDEFRYPGPKPQTKEAGLLVLADAIEASSRTLVDPTPSRVKGHIKTIVRKFFTEGQLDESELTLKDLHLAEEAFLRILSGIFHQRIEYPDQKDDRGKGKGQVQAVSKDADNKRTDKAASRADGKNGKDKDSKTANQKSDAPRQAAGAGDSSLKIVR